MESGWWRGPCLAAAVWLVVSSAVAAQIGGGALTGIVVDQGGAAVPGATLTITAAGTNLSRTAVTSDEGDYRRSWAGDLVHMRCASS